MNSEIYTKFDEIRAGICPKGFRKTKIGILPEKWKNVSFNNIFNESIKYVDDLEKAPLYSLTIENGVTPKTERYERSFLVKKEENNYKLVRPNDFVYNPMNLRFGALAKLKENFNVSVSGYYNIFNVNKEYNADFMEYYLKSRRMIYLYNSIATGSLKEKQRVHYSQFIKLNLPIPSRKEQDGIADVLGMWNKAIELKEKLLQEKQKQKKGLMERLLTGKVRLNGFNEEWSTIKLGLVIDIIKKESLPNPQDYKLLTVKLHVKGIEATDKKPNATEKGRPYYLREPGELLIGRQNFHNGGIGIVPKDMKGYIASNAITSLEITNGDLKFYFYYLSNPSFYRRIDNIIGGTGQKEISETMLKNLKVIIPNNLDEQKEIAKIIDVVDQEVKLLEKEIDLLKEQKKGLIQLLLTGIVRIKCN